MVIWMDLKFYQHFFLVMMILLFTGCQQSNSTGPQNASQALPVTVIEVQAKDTPVVFEYVGKTVSSRRVEVRSRVQGFLESRDYQEGTLVEEGQVMFQMDRKPFEAMLQAAVAEQSQQQASLTNARANLDRVRPLAKTNAVAEKDLDEAESAFRSAAAAVEAAKAKVVQAELNLSYTTIKAPVTGISSFATQQEGAFIGIGSNSLLTYVARIDPIWVEFSISENQLLRMRSSENALRVRAPESGEYEIQLIMADGSLYPETGRITFADASLSDKTGTFLVRAELANPLRSDKWSGQLRPGQFVRVLIKGAIRPDAILIPQRAVQQGAKGDFVWVVGENSEVEIRPVKVGNWRDDDWFINEGLNDGETVVIDGALKLRPGAKVKVSDDNDATQNKTAATGS